MAWCNPLGLWLSFAIFPWNPSSFRNNNFHTVPPKWGLRRSIKLNISGGNCQKYEAGYRHLWGLNPQISSQNTLEEFVSLKTASVLERCRQAVWGNTFSSTKKYKAINHPGINLKQAKYQDPLDKNAILKKPKKLHRRNFKIKNVNKRATEERDLCCNTEWSVCFASQCYVLDHKIYRFLQYYALGITFYFKGFWFWTVISKKELSHVWKTAFFLKINDKSLLSISFLLRLMIILPEA